MIDKFVLAMNDTEITLTTEEQMLFAQAVSALQTHQTFEQAVIAVTEEHLNVGEAALLAAKTSFDQASTDGVTAIQSAETSLLSKSTQLDIAASVPAALSEYIKTKDGAIGNLDDLLLSVPDGQFVETGDYGSGTPITRMIFCSDGEVRVHTIPNGQTSGTSGSLTYNHNFYKMDAGEDPDTGVFTKHQWCFPSSNTVRTSWSHRYGDFAACTELPLALSDDADTIAFRILIADYTTTTENSTTFRGIGLYYDSTYNLAAEYGHFHDADVRDSYGIRTPRLTSAYYANSGIMCILYDNNKNCGVVIQNGKVWYLYADGWVDPAIATFGDDAQAQTWVDTQNLIIIPMQNQGIPYTYEPYRNEERLGKTQANQDDCIYPVSARLSTVGEDTTTDSVSYNYSDSLPTAYRTSDVDGVNGVYDAGTSGDFQSWNVSQQHLWDVPSKTLIPCRREDVLDVVPTASAQSGANGAIWKQIKRRTRVTRNDTTTLIGESQINSMSKANGTNNGTRSADIAFYNPYSDRWFDIVNIYESSLYSTEIRRMIKLSDHIANKQNGDY